MQKNKKIVIAIAVAVICAVIALILGYNSLAHTETTIYIFKDSYSAGTPFSSDMIRAVKVDTKIVKAGQTTDISDLFITKETFSRLIKEGDVLNSDVREGTPLMISTINDKANNNVEVLMNKTAVAVTIPVNDTTGVTPNIQAESYVNVYVTYNSGGTFLLMENVRVLNASRNNNSLTGITLELDNEDAIRVIEAVNTGKVYCGIVNHNGYIYEEE